MLGAGLVARFLGSLLIAPRVSDPSRLIAALRVLALLTLLFALAFWAGSHVAWLLAIIIGFNLFFSPLVPLTDALANTWQKQITMDYGRVRLWGLYCLCDWFGADRQAGEPVRLPGDPADAKPGGRLDAARHAA
ncbi:3-phenylpropionic acid transporter [Klebsiella pneumoniae]|uniref:3-phenylpropionic acid transporter n=1 Tax=Klebsiella pneumoniae TaxID=573 RepID=A0A3S5DH82_KLEPN|nr:3-phenylpropionic acid transporter [Klebsiella pneumoniae]